MENIRLPRSARTFPLELFAIMNSIVLPRDVRGAKSVDPAEMPATHYEASEAFEVSCVAYLCAGAEPSRRPGDDGCPQRYLAFHLPHFRHLCPSTKLPMPVGSVDCLTSLILASPHPGQRDLRLDLAVTRHCRSASFIPRCTSMKRMVVTGIVLLSLSSVAEAHRLSGSATYYGGSDRLCGRRTACGGRTQLRRNDGRPPDAALRHRTDGSERWPVNSGHGDRSRSIHRRVP